MSEDAITQSESLFRILVADDVAMNLLMARTLLRKLRPQCQIDEAPDGKCALELAQTQVYTLLLLDVQMPGMDGTDVAKILRSQTGPSQKSFIVAMTGSTLPEEEHSIVQSGINEILPKPVTAPALLALLNKLGL